MSCLYILEVNPLSAVSFELFPSISEGHLFTLHLVSFAVQKLLSLIGPNCLLLFLFLLLYEVGHKRSWFDLCRQVFCIYFRLRGLQFLALYLGI